MVCNISAYIRFKAFVLFNLLKPTGYVMHQQVF